MNRYSLRLLMLGLLLVAGTIFAGCTEQTAPPPGTTAEITLFYGSEGNQKLVAEKRTVTFTPEEDKYKTVLTELIRGPETPHLVSNIDPQTEVYGTIIQDDALIVDFSKDFGRFSGSMAEVIGLGSVVNTLTQFEEIARVKILIEGKELIAPSGLPQGFMEPFPLEP